MTEHINFLLLGLANGAVFAALGLALVVTYRSSGVINFATCSIGLFAAYMYGSFREGELLLLIPGLPRSVRFADALPFWPAVLAALAVTSLFGLLLYAVVFRPLRTAPVVAKSVASLGLMVLLTGVMTQRMGTQAPALGRIFPEGQLHAGEVMVTKDRVLLTVSVIAIAVGVWALTRFTRFGLSTRAAAASEKGAYLSGISPDRLAALNWMLSAAVAGAAGILVGSIVPLIPIQYTLFIVPALATAILGGFERVLPTVLGGLVIGMVASEMVFLQVRYTWLPSSGLAELVPLVLILVVLVARAKPLPSRGVVLRPSLGRAPRPRAVGWRAAIGAGAGAAALLLLQGQWRGALVTSLIFAVISLSYVVVTGYSGQISLAQLTLAGVAGFLLASLTTDWELPLVNAPLPFPLAPIVAALGATVIGVVIAVPAVRIRGLPVAVVTLALAVVLEAAWFRNTDLVTSAGKRVTGPDLFGFDLTPGLGTADYPRLRFCFFVLAVVVAVAVGVAKLRQSRVGAHMLAVRANERSAAAAGIDVVRTKVAAFAIGAFIAGLGGALLAYKQGNVTWDSFSVFLGLGVFATVYLAGITSVSGGVVAGIACLSGLMFTFLDETVSVGRWYSTLAGIGLVLTVIANPEGMVGPVHHALDAYRARRVGGDGDTDTGAPAVPDATSSMAARPAPDRESGPDTGAGAVALAVRGLTVRYGGVVAVRDVDLEVREGRIVGLIGPNGAGKTSLIDAISGFAPCAGEVLLGDTPLHGLPPHRRVRAGLGRTFQAIELYEDLTVTENVIVGQAGAAGRGTAPAEHLARTFALLGLGPVRDRPAGELSQGTRQLVSIARALVGQPDVLLLDEPAGGLDTSESAKLGERLRAIRDSGVSILLCDHDMELVLDLCDEIVVVDFGEIIARGLPSEVRADPAVTSAYLGNRASGGANTALAVSSS